MSSWIIFLTLPKKNIVRNIKCSWAISRFCIQISCTLNRLFQNGVLWRQTKINASPARDASLTARWERIHTFKRHDKIPGRVSSKSISDACTDCGLCLRANICPVNALHQPEDPWPPRSPKDFEQPLYRILQGLRCRVAEPKKWRQTTSRHFFAGEVGIGVELADPE